MPRCLLLALCVFPCALLARPVSAEDPPKKLTPDERKEHEKKWKELMSAGVRAYRGAKYAEALKAFDDALALARQLYPKAEFPDGCPELVQNLTNLAALYNLLGRFADAEPLLKDALDMTRRRFKGDHAELASGMNNLAHVCKEQGKFAEAEPLYLSALEVRKRLFKGDHPELAASLNNLGMLYHAQGRLAQAEPLLKDALGMYKRLFKGDHPSVARGLNNLALLSASQGTYAEAEQLFKDALEMYKRMFKGDHPDVALGLNNLAAAYKDQDKYAEAEPLSKEALDMYKRLFPDDHPDVALGLNSLAMLYQAQGKLAQAEPLLTAALDMTKRLFPGDNPDLASSLNNMALLYYAQGKLEPAERAGKEALDMTKRLFPGDHPDVAASLSTMAVLYYARGKVTDAEQLLLGSLQMSHRLIVASARHKAEGPALSLVARMPACRDGFLSLVRHRSLDPAGGYNPAAAYPALWTVKGAISRVFEQRQLQARAASTDPALVAVLDELVAARRRRAELLLAPPPQGAGARAQRGTELKAFDDTIARINAALPKLLPAAARADKLNDAPCAALQAELPGDAAVVDFARYSSIAFDNDRPLGQREIRDTRYVAFVVTRDRIVWIDLDTAARIEPAVAAWREAITTGKVIPAALPEKVRNLVWAKVRKALPEGVRTVYVCPDAALCAVPFGALPGDRPGTVLLEDFALATVPHAPFLLDKLWPQDPLKNAPPSALVVGGVKYDAELAAPAPTGASRGGDPLLKPGATPRWRFLDNTVGEDNGVVAAAQRKALPTTRLDGDKATTSAVLAALPKARYAHFATHGFFADPSFRGIFQLDERDYQQSLRGERIGRAANSPLVMSGLVFAGANNPGTPGRGILTGEQLIDLDLRGLDLAVLSACETGLGDVAGGEGTFGLQRAFHYAGARNVVGSLWKVPDAPTAALMALFYRNLWGKDLSPMESLRQAQLELYKNPGQIPELAKGFRGKFEIVAGSGEELQVKPDADGKAHPLLWAGFTLSGPGR